jgi:hypothetical protein
MQHLSVSDIARRISRQAGTSVPPHVISTLFYTRRLDDGRCPVVGRQRQIPEDYIPTIEAELRKLGMAK